MAHSKEKIRDHKNYHYDNKEVLNSPKQTRQYNHGKFTIIIIIENQS